MFLYSYHIVDSNGIEISPTECSKMSHNEKKALHTQIKRHVSPSKSRMRVLSLVGGGIRGYMLGKTLDEIEKITGKKIVQLFDCIVGTSTGVPIAFALSYPEELTVDTIINNPELSKPHVASPKFTAEIVTKIYSHYGAYIFANPALKRALDPFIKGKFDGKTYLSAQQIDEQIEHEGTVINLIAPHFQTTPNVTEAFNELRDKINLTKDLLRKLKRNNRINIDINIDIKEAAFLKAFLFYPLHEKIQTSLMKALEKMQPLEEQLHLRTLLLSTVDTLTSSEYVAKYFNLINKLLPKKELTIFIEQCTIELQKYYLEPFNYLKDSIADYEKFSATFFDKDGITEVLKRFIPRNSKLEDLLGYTAGLACVRNTLELRIFDNLNPNNRKISTYDAILASISAQIYFKSQKIGDEILVDAGCAIKSPSQAAFTLVSGLNLPNDTQIEIFEIGTGKTTFSEILHPQKLTRILNPSESVGMVMNAGKNSTSAILNLLASGKHPLLKYHPIDFDLGDQIFLEKATKEYLNTMSAAITALIKDDPKFEEFIISLDPSVLNKTPIISPSKVNSEVSFPHTLTLDTQPIIPTGLKFVSIAGDGNCLYSAISLYIAEKDPNFLRSITAAHLEENIDLYKGFFENGTTSAEQFVMEYCQKIRNDREWGGELEIIILTKLLGRPIIVIGENGKIINKSIINNLYLQDEANFNDPDKTPIFILYNGINHYSGLILEDGYRSDIILYNLLKESIQQENSKEQVESFFGNTYQFTKETYKKFSAEYNKHLILQASLPRITKRIVELAVDRVISKFMPMALNDLYNSVGSYKKYSATLYPNAPKTFNEKLTLSASSNPYNLEMKKEGIEVPILSIDGGGTRGIWPLKVLEYIEKSSGKPISDIFAIKGGTSVGGLICIILSIPGKDGKPFYKATDVANLLKDAEQIFPLGHYRKAINLLDPEKGVMFDNTGLKKVIGRLIKNATGKNDLQMKDLIGTNLGVLAFDNETLQPFFLTKLAYPEVSVINAAASTAGAPVYFPHNLLDFNGKMHKMGDGGIPDNNPVWYVYGMFNAAKQPGELAKILSLGTGMYLDAHPKRDEAPMWMAPAALLGFGMDSRTISQNSMMDMYSKANTSAISEFVRLQWDLPTKIDLTSSLPVAIPFESVPECLPIGYSGNSKVVDYNDLATTMAAKRMIEQDFTNFMSSFIDVENNYSPFNHLVFTLNEQENKFKQSWAVRLADSIDIKKILADFTDPVVKQDIFQLTYRVCISLSIAYEEELRDKNINVESLLKTVNYVVLTGNIAREARRMGLDEKGALAAYVNKVNILLNFLDDNVKEGILKFIFDEMTKIHRDGYYSKEPEFLFTYLIINIINFVYNHPDLHAWINYAERQSYNPNFLHKLAALTQIMPKKLAEPLIYSASAVGLKCLKLGVGIINLAYSYYFRKDLTPSSEESDYNTKIHQLIIEKDNQLMELFILSKNNILTRLASNNTQRNSSNDTQVNKGILGRIKIPSINIFSPTMKLLQLISPYGIKDSSIALGQNVLGAVNYGINLTKGSLDALMIIPETMKSYILDPHDLDVRMTERKFEEEIRMERIADIQENIVTQLDYFRKIILEIGDQKVSELSEEETEEESTLQQREFRSENQGILDRSNNLLLFELPEKSKHLLPDKSFPLSLPTNDEASSSSNDSHNQSNGSFIGIKFPQILHRINLSEPKQTGWNCFDVAVDLRGLNTSDTPEQTRLRFVEFALNKSADYNFRQLLAPEIKNAFVISCVHEFESDRNGLPGNMLRNTRWIQAATKKWRDYDLALQSPLPEEKARTEKIFYEFFKEETAYKDYITGYYKEKLDWFAFSPEYSQNNTSMIDIAARYIGKNISIYERDSNGILKLTYTARIHNDLDINNTVHIEYKNENKHFINVDKIINDHSNYSKSSQK